MEGLERYTKGDSVHVSRFIDQYYPITAGIPKRFWTPEYYDWKYGSNPYGRPIVWHYWKDGDIIGTFGAVPVPLAVRGEKVVGYQLVDAYIAPQARGKGVFSRLADAVFNEIDRSSDICYGMGPSLFSLPIFTQKYGAYTGLVYRQFFDVQNTGSFINAAGMRFLGPCGVVIDLLKRGIFRRDDIHVEETGECDPSVAWETSETLDFTVWKERDYIRYRYHQCPESYRYFVTRGSGLQAGFIVKTVNWRDMNVCFIVDVLGDCQARRTIHYVLQASAAIARSAGSGLLSIEVPTEQADWTTYLAHGFVPHRRRECIFLRQTKWAFLNPESHEYDETRWELYTGDSDHI